MSPESFLLFATVVAFEGAAAAAVIAGNGGVLDDGTLRMCCLAGSSIGAVLHLAFEAETRDQTVPPPSLKTLARKMVASAIGGVLFTPLIIRYAGISIVPDMVACFSGIVAFASITTLKIASGIYRKRMARYLEAKAAALGLPGDDEPDPGGTKG